MRRMSGRHPNFVLVGLAISTIILVFKCWTLSSQNEDLVREIEKLQTELKISGMKQEQFEKKNQILQGNIHDLDEKQQKMKFQFEDVDQKHAEDLQNIKLKDDEIMGLKSDLLRKEETDKDLIQQIEDKDNKIEELVSDSQHILTLKNEAEEALSEKDAQINNLKRELEQVKSVATEYEARLGNLKEEMSKLKSFLGNREKPNGAPPVGLPIVPVPKSLKLTVPDLEQKEPYFARGGLGNKPNRGIRTRNIGMKGMKLIPGAAILPRQPPNAKRAKPRFSVADLVKNQKLESANQIQQPDSKANLVDQLKSGLIINEEKDHSNNVIPNPPLSDLQPPLQELPVNGVLEKPNNKPVLGELPLQELGNPVLQEPQLESQKQVLRGPPLLQRQQNPVLMPPHNPNENLDQAVDEEVKVVEDPSDDQDEEGKEIKHDLENGVDNYDNYDDEKLDNPHLNKDDNVEGGPHEPHGIGALEVPRHERVDRGGGEENRDEVNLDDDADHHANERLIDGNMEKKLRNLRPQPLVSVA